MANLLNKYCTKKKIFFLQMKEVVGKYIQDIIQALSFPIFSHETSVCL